MAVLETILEKRFFAPWREGDTGRPGSLWRDANLELFITPACNQNCEYCYLVRHEELYPRDIRDPETIKQNLHVFLDWCLEQGFSFHQVDLFSGEIWHSPFGWEVLDILLSYIRRGLRVNTVMIPTNASFVLDDRALVEMANRIEDYGQAGCFLQLSGSIDGGKADGETRKGTSDAITAGKTSEDFYDRFFSFWSRFGFRFHPMVSRENVKHWKENFLWWEEMCEKYGYDAFRDVMMLEVRNDGWTENEIKAYTGFLDFLVDRFLETHCGGDVKKLANHLFLTDIFSQGGEGYVNFGLTKADSFQGCTASDMLTVRLGDLAIPACHRTAYDHLLYGKFKMEEGRIVGLEENNPQMASRVLLQDSILCSPGCDCCPYSFFCLRGCYGSQQETENDPFMPIESVCRLFKAKIDFLIGKFERLGVWDELRKTGVANARYEAVREMLDAVERIAGKGGGDCG